MSERVDGKGDIEIQVTAVDIVSTEPIRFRSGEPGIAICIDTGEEMHELAITMDTAREHLAALLAAMHFNDDPVAQRISELLQQESERQDEEER